MLHFNHSVTPCRQFPIVSDYNRRQLPLQMAFSHERKNFLARFEIQVACRLVGQEEHGIRKKRPCDGNPLLLPARELIGEMVASSC